MTLHLNKWVDRVRSEKPLVHNITNLVVTNIAANALLSIGASPVMAYAHEEVADMAKIAHALSLNMGTLTPEIVVAMKLAGTTANQSQVPIVFDPVGVGATPYRSQVAKAIASQLHLTVLRGNAGEMSVFLDLGGTVQGVDSVHASANLPQAMKTYAKKHNTIVIATGSTDYVTDGESIWRLTNGHPLMAQITGSGCMLTAILGAFVGVVPKGSTLQVYAEACIAAITSYNLAAEQAAIAAQGPASFQVALLDALYHLQGAYVETNARIEREEERI